MYTNQQRILYARQLKRLHELYVVKSDIHLTYKYRNRNKAIANAQSLQDKIINAIIDDAVYGNSDKIRNIDSTINELMTNTLENERKRIHHKEDRYVDRAVELNAEKYSQILSNRINTEAFKLQAKIESELASGIHNGLSESETRNVLKDKYGNTAKARIKNIIKDSVHTNESNISFISALNDGYSYKVWMNGHGKGKVRAWHRAKLIAPQPIDEYFDIYGSYHAQAMYPGDLYAGAENVANCRCWLRYTNRRPEGLGEKKTVFDIPQSSYLNTSNNKGKNLFSDIVTLKPIETIKTSISHNTKKVTSKIKNIGQKVTSKFRKPKLLSKKHDPLEKTSKSRFPKMNKQVGTDGIDTEIHEKDNFEFDEKKLKENLREVLPKEITDDAINYIIMVLKKRGAASTEFGQIFGYKTGKGESIEFGDGSSRSVVIEATGYKKNKSQMSSEEVAKALKNPMKYKVSYIFGKSNLATQHNHPPNGLSPPSLDDIQLLMTQIWADYSVCISSKEIWVIEYKGKYNKPIYDAISRKVSKWENKAIKLLQRGKYDKANKYYGDMLQKYFNENNEYNIKMYRVKI